MSFLILIPLDICATHAFLITLFYDLDMKRLRVNENNIYYSKKNWSFAITAPVYCKTHLFRDFTLLVLPGFIFDFLLANVLLSE